MTISSLKISKFAKSKTLSFLPDALIVIGSSILIGLFAHISIPLPFTPVPISMQPHVVLLLAALLGSKRGALATIAFVAQGAIGMPVFAGGKAGILALVGPTGGYILGYIAAAYIVGYLVENLKGKKISSVFFSMATGNFVIYLFGMAWLSTFVGVNKAFVLGVLPFLLGDLFKLVIAAKAFKTFK
jgi:biotin transport system substrate-specific component